MSEPPKQFEHFIISGESFSEGSDYLATAQIMGSGMRFFCFLIAIALGAFAINALIKFEGIIGVVIFSCVGACSVAAAFFPRDIYGYFDFSTRQFIYREHRLWIKQSTFAFFRIQNCVVHRIIEDFYILSLEMGDRTVLKLLAASETEIRRIETILNSRVLGGG